MATNARAYTPELAAVLQAFGGMQTCVDAGGAGATHEQRLGRESSRLVQLVYRALFGNAAVMEALVLYWLETLPHPTDPRTSEDETLAAMLHALATAPAAPCVRVHRVGAKQRYHAVFHPFGVGADAATGPLVVPLEHADPRLVRALQHLVTNPWAFRHMDEDPTFGFFTLSCFAYDCEAQEELDACRPVALCAALRAVTLRIRRETLRGTASAASATGPLTYVRAATEERIRARLEKTLMGPGRWAQQQQPASAVTRNEKSRPERELLHDTIQFVWHERTATSLPHPRAQEIRRQMARAGVSLPPAPGAGAVCTRDQSLRLAGSGGASASGCVQHTVLPTPREIYAFSDQVMGEWLRVLHLWRARDTRQAKDRRGRRR